MVFMMVDGIYKVRFMPSFTDKYTFEIEASFDINAGEEVPDEEAPEHKLGTAGGGKTAEKMCCQKYTDRQFYCNFSFSRQPWTGSCCRYLLSCL